MCFSNADVSANLKNKLPVILPAKIGLLENSRELQSRTSKL